MTREEAEALVIKRNRHVSKYQRNTHTWVTVQNGKDWSVRFVSFDSLRPPAPPTEPADLPPSLVAIALATRLFGPSVLRAAMTMEIKTNEGFSIAGPVRISGDYEPECSTRHCTDPQCPYIHG